MSNFSGISNSLSTSSWRLFVYVVIEILPDVKFFRHFKQLVHVVMEIVCLRCHRDFTWCQTFPAFQTACPRCHGDCLSTSSRRLLVYVVIEIFTWCQTFPAFRTACPRRHGDWWCGPDTPVGPYPQCRTWRPLIDPRWTDSCSWFPWWPVTPPRGCWGQTRSEMETPEGSSPQYNSGKKWQYANSVINESDFVYQIWMLLYQSKYECSIINARFLKVKIYDRSPNDFF